MSYATFASFSNVDREQEGTCLQTDYDIIDVCTSVKMTRCTSTCCCNSLGSCVLLFAVQTACTLWLHLTLLLIRDCVTTAGGGVAV